MLVLKMTVLVLGTVIISFHSSAPQFKKKTSNVPLTIVINSFILNGVYIYMHPVF